MIRTTLLPGYVDLHTHILPALDDGPADLDTSIALVRAAAAGGSGVLVATSHSEEVLQHGGGGTAMAARLDEVRQAVALAGINVSLLLGSEIYLEPDTPARLRRQELLPLNGSRYVLVELPFQALPIYVDQTLFALQTEGYVPVIAHPERNAQVQREPEKLYTWVTHGALVQLSAISLLGGLGRAAARVCRLAITHHLCHAIASDAHDPLTRPPALQPAFVRLRDEFGPAVAQALLDDQPRAIVEDRPLDLPEPLPIEANSDGNVFWRLFGRG
ncbi:MAG: tyrosine-protein phosphatase [Chloroflexota bacterium]